MNSVTVGWICVLVEPRPCLVDIVKYLSGTIFPRQLGENSPHFTSFGIDNDRDGTTLLVTTSPEVKHSADRMGLTAKIEQAGGVVASGICFYQSYAREMAEANGWHRLLTNSAKLVNIIGGYGYAPSLATTERCVDSAVAGRMR